MCGGGKPKTPAPAVYSANDGWQSQDPNQVADRNRKLQLASAFGYDGQAGLENWVTGLDAPTKTSYNEYDTQGMTAADYRAEKRLKEQEAQAAAAEQQRKDSIAQSRGAVDTQFGTYNDDYYNNISKTVMDYYQPQLDDQFKNADEQLTFKLARQGLLKSDTAGKERADLQSKYDLERSGLTNKASDASRQAKEGVSSAKSQLYSYADVAADPAAVNDRLASETSRLNAYAPELTPMGQIFTDYITPIVQNVGSGLMAESQGYKGYGTGLFNNNKSTSAQVVR